MLVISGIVYLIFSTSEVQSWNSPKEEVANDGEELKCLKDKTKEEGHADVQLDVCDKEKVIDKR